MGELNDITIRETRDVEMVWLISQSPSIFERVTNDQWGSLNPDTRKCHVKLIVENPHNHSLLVLKGQQPVGCFIMDSKGGGEFEVHTMLLPECRGQLAIEAGRAAMKYAQQFEGVKRLVSYCPANLPETYLFARYCGWRKVGPAPFKWTKDGVDHPVTIVELTPEKKEEAACL